MNRLPDRRRSRATCSLACCALLAVAFRLEAGLVQVVLMGAGPAVTGVLADRLGLLGALQVVPLVALAAALAFALGQQRPGSPDVIGATRQ